MRKFENIKEIITLRQTCKDFDGSEIPKPQIESLLELAVHAPNHRLTEPWKFRILDREKIQNLAEHLEIACDSQDFLTLKGSVEKLRKVSCLIYFTYDISPNPTIAQEDYAACAAATQNILLGATALGLDSFWSSGRAMLHPETQKFIGMNTEIEGFVAAIWLGRATQHPERKPRKAFSDFTLWM